MSLAKRINKVIGDTPFQIDAKREINQTISIGFTIFPALLDNVDMLG